MCSRDEYLGSVAAPEAEAAAIKQFGQDQRRRLLIRERA
jgi:hypothetical protein